MSDYRGLIEDIEKRRQEGTNLDPAGERLVCLLYLLMRDELPTGAVCRIISDISGDSFEFTNPHLEALARDYADRIREG